MADGLRVTGVSLNLRERKLGGALVMAERSKLLPCAGERIWYLGATSRGVAILTGPSTALRWALIGGISSDDWSLEGGYLNPTSNFGEVWSGPEPHQSTSYNGVWRL